MTVNISKTLKKETVGNLGTKHWWAPRYFYSLLPEIAYCEGRPHLSVISSFRHWLALLPKPHLFSQKAKLLH